MMVGSGCQSYFVLPLSRRRFIPFFQRDVDEESLGRQFVAGVQATGTRFTTIESGRGERWVSPELKLVVHVREEHPKLGTVEYRLTAIGNDETRPELFEFRFRQTTKSFQPNTR
jgi:hypothetical protein